MITNNIQQVYLLSAEANIAALVWLCEKLNMKLRMMMIKGLYRYITVRLAK